MTHKSGNMGMGFLVGLGIGAVTGILLAPRKGEETREQIKQKAMEIRGRAMEVRDRITEQVSDQVEEAGEMAHRTADDIAQRTRQTTAKMSAEKGKNTTADR